MNQSKKLLKLIEQEVEPDEIFIRSLKKSEYGNPTRSLSSIPNKDGYEKVYKPYGSKGKGFYYTKQGEAK